MRPSLANATNASRPPASAGAHAAQSARHANARPARRHAPARVAAEANAPVAARNAEGDEEADGGCDEW